jgi:D-3-phosphoglycerate dehydrogenase
MAASVLVLDFDSTFTRVEALDVLAEFALAGDPERDVKLAEVARLTELAMSGALEFGEALSRRLALLGVRREHLDPLVARLHGAVTPSIARNRGFFERAGERVWIVSGGFREYVEPVVAAFGVPPERVLANRFLWDAEGRATGADPTVSLSRSGGKAEAVRAALPGAEVVMVGDGWTDWEVRRDGAAVRFHAFVENVARPEVIEVADRVAASFDEVLHAEGLAGRWSFPRSRMKVLLLENVHPNAAAAFRAEGYEVETLTVALEGAALADRLRGVSVLGIRSRTRLTREALAGADRLLAVAAFCIGTNQIDLEAAAERGVAVFNAPYSNTRSVVELAVSEMIALLRGVFDKSAGAHAGRWDKSASGARELRGKTLGLVGYGAIGSQLSVLAEAMGMSVVYHDLVERLSLGNARRVRSLEELLARADVVSLHVDGRAENRNLIGREELGWMKPGAILLNLSRGHVVDVEALAEAIRSGRIGGAGVDVFPEEPESNTEPFTSPLQGLPNVILTPHVGGSTEEAQEAIADFAAERLLGFLHRGDTTFSVNLPNVQLPEVRGAHRFLHIHRNQPGVLAAVNGVLAGRGLNILAQHLKTDERTGYVIVDVDQDYGREVLDELKALPGTVRFRTIY